MRVILGGQTVAESDDVIVLHEPGRYPVAYFPKSSILQVLGCVGERRPRRAAIPFRALRSPVSSIFETRPEDLAYALVPERARRPTVLLLAEDWELRASGGVGADVSASKVPGQQACGAAGLSAVLVRASPALARPIRASRRCW
jgi:hypothetical protein